MSAAKALNEARASGIDVDVDGDDLVLEAAAPPPAAILDLLTRFFAAQDDEGNGPGALFTNLNDRGEGPVDGFEQNRLRAAIGSRLFGRIRAETGYEWQYADRRSGGFVNRHVFLIELAIDTGTIRRERQQ